ncbi:MAG: hypothetical protein RMA76_43635 [Deltaproteobacteria bacterium]|jgi:hypothetical protein
MKVITEDATIRCTHATGEVGIDPHQSWVTIEGRSVLVRSDPEQRPISRCPVATPNKPCTLTLVARRGYSAFVRIDGRPIVLDNLRGSTDGTLFPAEYLVEAPGQNFVGSDA